MATDPLLSDARLEQIRQRVERIEKEIRSWGVDESKVDYDNDQGRAWLLVHLFDAYRHALAELGRAIDERDQLQRLSDDDDREIEKLEAELTEAQHRASAEYEQRLEVQARLDLFKHQLSVQEARTDSWHHAYDALNDRLEDARREVDAAVTCLMDTNPPFNSLPWEAMRRLQQTVKVLASAPPAAPET